MRHDLTGVDWDSVLPRFGINTEFLIHPKKKLPCPVCESATGNAGKSRFTYDNRNGRGDWFCHHCNNGHGQGGDGISLIAHVNGWTYGEAIKQVFEGGNLSVREIVKTAPVVREPEISPKVKREKLSKAWSESRPVTEGDPAWNYLHTRVMELVEIPASTVIRLHPGMKYWAMDEKNRLVDKGTFPVMLALFTKGGKAITIHRTYLKPDGSAKADVDDPKKAMSGIEKMTGGAIELYPFSGGELGVAEGIEKSIAIHTAYLDINQYLPVWSTYSADVMKGFVLPPGVTKLHIFGDPDPKGKISSNTLKAKAEAAGVPVVMHEAKAGLDFDEVWNEICLRRAAKKLNAEKAEMLTAA